MYSLEVLKKYEYFENKDNISELTDPLTGVLRRDSIIGYANYLIEHKIPFALGIMDLDNFKLINDNYGHNVGDQLLTKVGQKFVEYMGNSGLVGRFGGDEFVFIKTLGIDYETMHYFFRNLYGDDGALRIKYNIEGYDVFVTASIGSADYPKDSDNYEELFLKADKALYRGKQKGRNCFIIYVHEKHKDIDISKGTIATIPEIIKEIGSKFDFYQTLEAQLNDILRYFCNVIHIEGAVYLDNKLNCVSSPLLGLDLKNIETDYFNNHGLKNNDFFIIDQADVIESESDDFLKILNENKIRSCIVCKAKAYSNNFGYIVAFSKSTERVWQNDDKGLLLVISRLAATQEYYEQKLQYS